MIHTTNNLARPNRRTRSSVFLVVDAVKGVSCWGIFYLVIDDEN
jgi:hypothetical protein